MAVLKLSQIAAAADNLGSGDFLVGVKGGTTDALFSIAGATVTASDPIFDMSQTWNNGAVNFTALKLNITDTASDSLGNLMLLQVGGSTKFRVRQDGYGDFSTGIGATTIYLSGLGNIGLKFKNVNGLVLTLPANVGGAISSDTANTISITDSNTANAASGLRVYNSRDTGILDPTNYERGVLDWTTSSNVLTIGTQAGGTGALQDVSFVGNAFAMHANLTLFGLLNATGRIQTATGNFFTWSDNAAALQEITGTPVIQFQDGTFSGATGWMQWGGQKRVTSDFTVTSSTALTNVTGLSVSVAAGRTYTFETELYVTDAAAGGVQAAIAGTATATAIQYTGYTIADNAIKAKTNATALATAVGSTVTTETSGIIVRISGTITVNAAGTLTVQMAQNTSNGTATTAKRGSYFIVHDMP